MDENERKQTIKATFDQVAPVYDKHPLRFFTHSSEHLASLLKLKGNENALDVATGTGNAAIALAKILPSGSVTGVDFSVGMLAQARAKADVLQLKHIKWLEMDMVGIESLPTKYDVVVSAFGIFFVNELSAQLGRMICAARPGGKIAICNFKENFFSPLRDLMLKGLESYNIVFPPPSWKEISSIEKCKELFARAKLKHIKVEEKNMGYFLADENEWWEIILSAGFRGLINQLSPADQEKFKAEHLREVAKLKTPKGLWLDIQVIFTTGVKRVKEKV